MVHEIDERNPNDRSDRSSHFADQVAETNIEDAPRSEFGRKKCTQCSCNNFTADSRLHTCKNRGCGHDFGDHEVDYDD